MDNIILGELTGLIPFECVPPMWKGWSLLCARGGASSV